MFTQGGEKTVCESCFISHKTHENKLIAHLVVMQIANHCEQRARIRMISKRVGGIEEKGTKLSLMFIFRTGLMNWLVP